MSPRGSVDARGAGSLPLRGTAVAAGAALSALLLASCSGGAGGDASAAGSATGDRAAAADSVTVEQPWLKAADSGMTSAFGELRNDGDTAVTLTGASADGIAGEVELHETAADPQTGASSMQAREEPLLIGPGETAALEPGGDHLMLMDLQCAPMAGTELSLELQFDDGSATTVELPVRDYAGAQEEYAPGEQPSGAGSSEAAMSGMEGMAHGGAHDSGGQDALPMCEAEQ